MLFRSTYLVLLALERRNIRPVGSGLIAGAFLTVYFGLRIFVEQYKDFYVEEMRELGPFRNVEQWLGFPIHTGQWLSVLPVFFGVLLIGRALMAVGPGADGRDVDVRRSHDLSGSGRGRPPA